MGNSPERPFENAAGGSSVGDRSNSAASVAPSVDRATVDQHDGRRRILDASAELFVDQGYVGTSLRQIAGAAGMQPASVYHHFSSKEALFIAVLDDGIDVMVEAFRETKRLLERHGAQEQTGAAAHTGRRERVQAHVRAHLGAVFEHGPYTTAHVTAFFSSPIAVRKQGIKARDGYEQLWSDLFSAIFSERAPADRRLHRLLLFGAMNATVEWYDPAGDLSLDELASAITDQFLYGVNPSDPQPPRPRRSP